MKLLTLRTEIKTKALEVLSPSDGHRFGGAVTGDDGDETRVVCVLLEKQHSGSEGVSFHDPNARDYLCDGTFLSYSQDEADGGHSGRGHDFGAVGHQVQQRGHDALRSVVKLVTQDGR